MTESNNPTTQNKKSHFELFSIIFAIICIFIIWLKYPSFMTYMDEAATTPPAKIVIPYKTPQEIEPNDSETNYQKIGNHYGTYGDSYGSLNTLFSGLAFSMLIISVFMQRKELQAQREELEAQRNEIKESNDIARQQREITKQQADLNAQQIHDAKVQNFFTLLFKFLDEKRRKVDDLGWPHLTPDKASTIFDVFIDNSIHHFKSCYLDLNSIKNDHYDEIELIFEDLIMAGHNSTFNCFLKNSYFEHTCFILRFIEENENLGIRDNAIKIFSSYQSVNEMATMFIISLDNNELKDFILKYALLRKLSTYDSDKHFLFLVDKILGKKSYLISI